MTVTEALNKIIVDLDALQVTGYKNFKTLVGCINLLTDVRDTLNNPPKEAQPDDHEGDSDQGDEDEDA